MKIAGYPEICSSEEVGAVWRPQVRQSPNIKGRGHPGVSMTFLAALVLDCGSDVPDAYLERQRVLPVHAAQLVHERDHVPHGTVRQALHAHELSAASLREARDRTCRDSVRVGHTHPPCPAVRNRPRGSAAIRGLWQLCSLTDRLP